jgi:hypothetical protein
MRDHVSILANNIVSMWIFILPIILTITVSFFVWGLVDRSAISVILPMDTILISFMSIFGIVTWDELKPRWEYGSLLNTVESFEAWLHTKVNY